MTRPRFVKSYREGQLERNAADRYYAAMAGKEPRAQVEIKPKRVAAVRNAERVTEAHVNKDIRRFADVMPNLRLWRNNRGMVQLPGGGALAYGVGPNGASDWIGYKRVMISSAQVGQVLAVFVAVEAKAPDGEIADNQRDFLRTVREDGGYSCVARSGKDLEKL